MAPFGFQANTWPGRISGPRLRPSTPCRARTAHSVWPRPSWSPAHSACTRRVRRCSRCRMCSSQQQCTGAGSWSGACNRCTPPTPWTTTYPPGKSRGAACPGKNHPRGRARISLVSATRFPPCKRRTTRTGPLRIPRCIGSRRSTKNRTRRSNKAGRACRRHPTSTHFRRTNAQSRPRSRTHPDIACIGRPQRNAHFGSRIHRPCALRKRSRQWRRFPPGC